MNFYELGYTDDFIEALRYLYIYDIATLKEWLLKDPKTTRRFLSGYGLKYEEMLGDLNYEDMLREIN